jgi:DNA-binding HxlR family transcriptional regulator
MKKSKTGGIPMKKCTFKTADCPIAQTLEVVGDAWTMLVVRDALVGKRRFGEFERSLGIAKNILTDRLKNLTARGVLRQVPASDGSAFREYELTEKGRGLIPVIIALRQWSGGMSHYKLVESTGNKRVRVELRTEDGRKVGLEDVRMVAA